MWTETLVKLTGVSICLCSGVAGGVERPEPVIPVFNEDLMTNLAGIDLSTNAGIEAVGGNQSLVILDLANPSLVKSRLKFQLRARSSANNALLLNLNLFVDTRPYPDPESAVGTSYFCEDDGSIRGVDPTSEFFPCDYDVNIGIANAGATRYLVTSLGVYSWYENIAAGSVDIGQASVWVWDPATGAELWHDTWVSTRGEWELDAYGLSAVGDFLNADGVDELRVAYSRELNNNRLQMEYRYYDIATGNEISASEQTFVVPSP